MNISWKQNITKERIETFNYKNIDGQKKFKEVTTKTTKFTNIFQAGHQDINTVGKKFMKVLMKMSHKCFKKLRSWQTQENHRD